MNLPHPLEKFSSNGQVADAVPAQIILDFIQDVTLAPDSNRAMGALWFLIESKTAFFFACACAGIDGDKLREHLRKSFKKESQ